MSNEYTRKWWKERLHLIQAFAEGKRLQVNIGGIKSPAWDEIVVDPRFTGSPLKYRIAPEPKLRPWKPEEVPVGALVRYIGDDKRKRGCWLINYVDDGGIPIPAGNKLAWISLEILCLQHQHSTDGGKTWKPCGVM